ncbi:MAG: hypothetical protein PHR20_02595 [Bacteroidales bacterium]|nr:hypothetical protein [Bacteroidales bacterium]
MNKHLLILLSAVTFGVFLSYSCGTAGKVGSSASSKPEALAKESISAGAFVDSMFVKSFRCEAMSCRYECAFSPADGSTTRKIRGIINYTSKGVITANVVIGGINVASVKITNDTALIINKLQRTYQNIAFPQDGTKDAGFYDILESLLMGGPCKSFISMTETSPQYSMSSDSLTAITYDNVGKRRIYLIEYGQVAINSYRYADTNNSLYVRFLSRIYDDLWRGICTSQEIDIAGLGTAVMKYSRHSTELISGIYIKVPDNYIKIE